MTKQEQKVFEIICKNPFIEQAEIAKLLGIKRSTVAVHITNLQKQGYIAGKGYILNKGKYVLGIGAANVDVYGKSTIKIRQYYDHPANINTCVGGVTKNIITNLSRLNINTKLITAVGDDCYGKMIIDDCDLNNIDSKNIIISKNKSTGVFMQVQDENNDMHLALCDMSVLDDISPEYIEKKKNVVLNAELVLIDSSLRIDTIEKIIELCKDKVPIYVNPVSDNYALKIKPYVKGFTCIEANKTELENLSGIKIESDETIKLACKRLFEKGLEKIFVSRGKDGILYLDSKGNVLVKKFKSISKIVNASGAGDAAMSGILYGIMNNMEIEDIINYGLAAGSATIMSQSATNTNLSISLLNEIIKENKK